MKNTDSRRLEIAIWSRPIELFSFLVKLTFNQLNKSNLREVAKHTENQTAPWNLFIYLTDNFCSRDIILNKFARRKAYEILISFNLYNWLKNNTRRVNFLGMLTVKIKSYHWTNPIKMAQEIHLEHFAQNSCILL